MALPFQNIPTSIPGAAASPPEMASPGMATEPPADGAGMTQEEMKSKLADLMAKVEDKYRELNATSFMNKNQIEASRQDVLRDALKLMTRAGVDISNPESIQKFMDSLSQANPDLYQLFEQAFESLLSGEEEPSMVPSSEPPVGLGTPTDMQQPEVGELGPALPSPGTSPEFQPPQQP